MSTDTIHRPSNWSRFLWELVIFGLLAAAIYGAWELQAYRSRQALALESARWTAEVARLEQRVAEQAGKQDTRSVEVAFRAFAAGLAAANLETLGPALDALLRVEEIRFVHLLHPDGTVMATSDRKLETLGRADERATWSLGVSEVVVRSLPGGSEAAGPITLRGESAVLWMGWHTP